jgi:Family of unknown function (DUF6252)
MKKRIYFILTLVVLASCSQDVTFNDKAAFQGVKDNEFWKASDAKAAITNNNKLTIEAVTLNETLTLKMPLPTTIVTQKNKNSYITHILGTSETKKASYIKILNLTEFLYQTGTSIGDGEIVITDYDGTTVSGTYRFNAENADPDSTENPIVNLQNGVFYKVPIVPAL